MEPGTWCGTDKRITGKWEAGGEHTEDRHVNGSLEGNRQKKDMERGAWCGTDKGNKWKVEPGLEQTNK